MLVNLAGCGRVRANARMSYSEDRAASTKAMSTDAAMEHWSVSNSAESPTAPTSSHLLGLEWCEKSTSNLSLCRAESVTRVHLFFV